MRKKRYFKSRIVYKRRIKPRFYVFLTLVLLIVALVVLKLIGVIQLPFDSNSSTSETTILETTAPTMSELPTATPTPTPILAPTPTPTPTPEPVVRTPGHENMPEYASVAPLGNIQTLEDKVTALIKTFPGKYGVTFVNLATGERFGIQDTDEYIAASTSKFPMNILLWKRIAAGEIDPEMMLTYQKEDLETGTGIIQQQPYGTQYTVRETSRLSVVYSDNCGINMIIRLLDIEDIRQYIKDQGGVVEYGKRHRSCPADMANCAVDLYKFYWEDPTVAGELIESLENTKWKDERMSGNLPKDVKVAHKIGNQTRTANDVGIVFASQPYVLSVMTENVDFDGAVRNIAKLSKLIYDEMEAAVK